MTAIPPPSLALLGGREPWPLAGHLRGSLQGAEVGVAWAGCVAHGAGPEAGWRASRNLERVLRRGGAPTGDARRALSVLWTRLDAATDEALGPAGGTDLVLLLAARDPERTALSAVGLATVYGEHEGVLRPWLTAPHPLLGPAGRPAERPGALSVGQAPSWVVGVVGGAPDLDGVDLDWALPRCGVHG